MNDNIIEMIPEMITIKECSTRTGISYDWIRKMCIQNRIVYIRAGNKYLINFSKFVAYLNEGDGNGGDNEKNCNQ